MTRRGVLPALAVTATLLAGCTVSVGDRDGDGGPGTATDVAMDASTDTPTGGTPEAIDGGVPPQELSRALLDAGDAEGTVIGSVTAPVDRLRGVEVTMEVLGLERTRAGTRATLRLSTSGADVSVSTLTFGAGRSTSQYFLHDLLLEDVAVTEARYRPLRWEDYRQACACPFLPLAIGTEPRTVSALFPPLPPEVDRATLRLGEGPLAVEGLPVADGG